MHKYLLILRNRMSVRVAMKFHNFFVYFSCQVSMLIFLLVFTFAFLAKSHPITIGPPSNEDECLAKNVERLRVLCTYSGKSHPCFEGTILYRNRPIHLLNMEGISAHFCKHGTRTNVIGNYCCFTQKCLQLCYESNDFESQVPAFWLILSYLNRVFFSKDIFCQLLID